MKAKNTYLFPLLIIGILFFIIGFGVGISGFLTPFLTDAFDLSMTQSYLVTTAIFSAFVIFGAPSGWFIQKAGYKKAMVVSFIIMAIGMFLFIPSAKLLSFPLFLMALFIGGIGNTLLQTAVNPYVTIIGPEKSAAKRFCFMGIMNKSAWWLSSLFLGVFLDLNHVNINDIEIPFYLVTLILITIACFLIFIKLPEIKAKGENEDVNNNTNNSNEQNNKLKHYPHLILGIITLFLYVGVETLPMVSVLGFAKTIFNPLETNLSNFALYVPVGLMGGYLFGVFAIPKLISQANALKVFALLGIISSICLIFFPGKLAIYCMILIGLSNSLMWPAIWPLAIADLGNFTKKGSSFLVMGVVGGGIIPLVFGLLLDRSKIEGLVTTSSYQHAYWIFVPIYLFILYFALHGYKIRINKLKR